MFKKLSFIKYELTAINRYENTVKGVVDKILKVKGRGDCHRQTLPYTGSIFVQQYHHDHAMCQISSPIHIRTQCQQAACNSHSTT